MRILYLGDDHPNSTSRHRSAALGRLGHEVEHHHAHRLLPPWHWLARINVRSGFRLFARRIFRGMTMRLRESSWDLVWIDGGAELPPALYRWLRQKGRPIVNYVTDNPFVRRDHRKWDQYLACLPLHDLSVFPREENLAQARAAGARRVMRVYFSYDPVAHHPELAGGVEPGSRPEVWFVGSWMPERGPILETLRKAGIPVKISGDGWPRAREWKSVKECWEGGSVYGADYVRQIRQARVTLGLLSKGNRDLHTTRSVEIPFIGGAVFCGERTSEHQTMYREREEAFFWSTPAECVAVCRRLLQEPALCRQVAAKARHRVIGLALSNDEVLSAILHEAEKATTPPPGHLTAA